MNSGLYESKSCGTVSPSMPGTTTALHLHLHGQRLVTQKIILMKMLHVHGTRVARDDVFRDVWQGEYWWLLPWRRRWAHGKESLDDERREGRKCPAITTKCVQEIEMISGQCLREGTCGGSCKASQEANTESCTENTLASWHHMVPYCCNKKAGPPIMAVVFVLIYIATPTFYFNWPIPLFCNTTIMNAVTINIINTGVIKAI